MYCPKCGALNDDDASQCTLCDNELRSGWGKPDKNRYGYVHREPVREHIPSYLLEAILVTICCSPLFGIIAIVYAAKVTGKLSADDFTGARQASDNAKLWVTIGVVIGIIVGVIAFIIGINEGLAEYGDY